MVLGTDGSMLPQGQMDRELTTENGANIILLGATGAGKSTTGWVLARFVGYGFIDLDAAIEAKAKQTTQQIFDTKGEAYFRRLETEMLQSLRGLRSHVLALGGGAVVEDENWELIQHMGTTVWVNTPPEEIARRLLANEQQLAQRPLLAEVLLQKDIPTRHKLLSERLKALIGNRVSRYKQARVTVADSFSTPESTAHLIKDALLREELLRPTGGQQPFDRWQIL